LESIPGSHKHLKIRAQDCCDFGIDSQTPTTWLDLIHSQTMAFLTDILREYNCKVLYVGKGRLQVYCLGEFVSWEEGQRGEEEGEVELSIIFNSYWIISRKDMKCHVRLFQPRERVCREAKNSSCPNCVTQQN